MICFIVATSLALAGSAFGQCPSSSYIQQGNCTDSFSLSLAAHVGNGELLCGDFAKFKSCILRITCLPIEGRNDLIDQARNALANLNAYCPTSFPFSTTTSQTGCISNADLDECSRIFGLDAYSHLSNPTQICWDLTSFGNCIENIPCLTTERKSELMDQARNVVSNLNVTCATYATRTTTSDYSDCTNNNQLDACTSALGFDAYSHLGNTQLVCSDFAKFENCILSISCLSFDRKNELLAQGRNVLSNFNVYCPTNAPWMTTRRYEATNAPWMTTRRYEDCFTLTQLDTCSRIFGRSLYLHSTDQQLVCRDFGVFTDCILGISCLKSQEQYQLILDARGAVNDLNIFCDGIGPDYGDGISGATLSANKSFSSCLLVLVAMIFISLK